MVSNAEGPTDRLRTIFYLFRFRYEVTANAAGVSLAGEPPENQLCRQVIAEVRTELALPSHDLGTARIGDADVREYLKTLLAAYDEGTIKYECPSCGKPLISRLSPLCSYCGARLPSELLFSEEEKERIEADDLRARKALEEADAERKRKGEGAFLLPPSF
jgi:hypothetical protein